MKSMKIQKIISNQPSMNNMIELSRKESEATSLDDFDRSYGRSFTIKFVPSLEVCRTLLNTKLMLKPG